MCQNGTLSNKYGTSVGDLWGNVDMDRVWVRNTAISAAIACGAMVAGPGVTGTPVASADLLGIGVDVLGILGHKDNKKNSHHRPGANNKQNRDFAKTGRPGQTGKQKTRVGDQTGSRKAAEATGAPTGVSRTQATVSEASVDVAEVRVSVPQIVASLPVTGGGGGGGGAAKSTHTGRAPNLVSVPTAPSSRQIVIRAQPPAAHSAPAAAAPVTQSPAVAAPAIPVVVPPVPVVLPPVPVVVPPAPSGGGGVPAAPPAAPSTPHRNLPTAQAPQPSAPVIRAVPETFRVGYADYLRAANTTDLLFAVLPGLAGMVLLTAAGGAVGFRQARAARDLPSPQIARFLP